MTPSRTRRLRGLALVTRSHDGSTIVDWVSSKTRAFPPTTALFDRGDRPPDESVSAATGRKWFFYRPRDSRTISRRIAANPRSLLVQLLLKFNSKNVESGYKLLKSLKAQNRRCKTESIKRNEIIPIEIYLGNYFGRNVGCSTIKYKYKHEK